MKNILLLFICMLCGTAAFSQRSLYPPANPWPVGGCPLPPADALSFMLTAHSSDGREAKVYYEVKVRGNAVPDNWRLLIQKLPRGSTVSYTDIVVIQNGERKFLPDIIYTMW